MPGQNRVRAVAIIIAMVALIGWLDYLAGIRISLALFYFVPITLSVAWLGWRAACLTAISSTAARIVGDLATGPYRDPLAAYWNRFMDLTVYCFVVWVIHALISLWRQLDQRVRQRTAALEQAIATRDQLQNQLFEVSRRERSAIGHDLHDGLGQHLTATAIAANLLAGRLATRGDPAAADARSIEKLIQEGIGKTRQIARGLLLAAIEAEELVPELEELATKIGEEQHVACRFTKQGDCRKLRSGYRVASLLHRPGGRARNAVRHRPAHPSGNPAWSKREMRSCSRSLTTASACRHSIRTSRGWGSASWFIALNSSVANSPSARRQAAAPACAAAYLCRVKSPPPFRHDPVADTHLSGR